MVHTAPEHAEANVGVSTSENPPPVGDSRSILNSVTVFVDFVHCNCISVSLNVAAVNAAGVSGYIQSATATPLGPPPPALIAAIL